jgi:hypothetical protein
MMEDGHDDIDDVFCVLQIDLASKRLPKAVRQGNIPRSFTLTYSYFAESNIPIDMSAAGQSHGQLVRLRALYPSQLPAHPDMAAKQGTASALPDLDTFITSILTEASDFMTEYLPQKFSIKDRSKTSPPAKATVQLLAHEIAANQLGANAHDEAWFARTSLHENKKENGTASWDEFEAGLLDDHSLHESQYTPDVFDAHKVLSWDDKLAEKQAKVGNWEKFGLNSE